MINIARESYGGKIMNNSEQQKRAQNTKRQGVFTKTVTFIISLPMPIFVTMIISICVEWFVMYKFYPEMGADHSLQILQQEAKYLNTHFKESLLGSNPITLAGDSITWVDDHIFNPLGIKEYKKRSKQERSDWWTVIVSAYTIVKVVILRLCVLFLSLPAYLLFATVGIVIGLVERDLRKFGSGRESADRFELSRKLISPSIILCFILYISWPNSINPAFIVVPFAALFGYSIYLTISNYKKYL